MNICLLEDSGSSMLIQKVLCDDEGHTLDSTDDYRDIAEWISTTPDSYNAIILDLKIENYVESLPHIPNCKDYKEELHYSPTLHFINNFLLVRFPLLKEKIILFSAYIDEFQNNGCKKQLDEFETINKNDPGYIDNLIIAINQRE